MTSWSYPVFRAKNSKLGTFYDWTNPSNPPSGDYNAITQYSKGENYTGTHHRDPDGKYRSGGAWLMDKKEVSFYGTPGKTFRGGLRLAYDGAYKLSDSNDLTYVSGYIPNNTIEDHNNIVNSYGAQAYAALKPDTPDFSPATSLFELREMPDLLRNRYRHWRNTSGYVDGWSYLGNEYLNIWFGWFPLFSDILAFTRAFSNGKKRFNQMLRDEGRPVRRKRFLKKLGNDKDNKTTPWSDVVHGTAWNPNLYPVHVTQCYGGGNATTRSREWKQTKVWCAGRSRYFLPPGPRDDGWRNDMARRILGLRLTPSAVYNAIPWTWLADYFGGLGDFMDAISPGITDNVVFDYAYLMYEIEYGLEQVGTQYVFTSPTSTGPVSATRQFYEARKTRIAASPFGFGLKHADLNPKQLAILAALGLTMS